MPCVAAFIFDGLSQPSPEFPWSNASSHGRMEMDSLLCGQQKLDGRDREVSRGS